MFFNNANVIRQEPGVIVGPISNLLGFVLDFIYNIFYFIAPGLALGLAIIFFTIIVRILLLPLAIKQHKSMMKMRALKPDIDKINKKYEGKITPDDMRNKNIELQELYREKKANPLAGCIPALVQWPIFITLFSMFQSPFAYIIRLNEAYGNLVSHMQSIENWYYPILNIQQLGLSKLPNPNYELPLSIDNNVIRLIFTYSFEDWQLYFSQISQDYVPALESLIQVTRNMETFLGIDMVASAGFNWPAILLPIITAVSSFFMSQFMMKKNPLDPNAPGASFQKSMMYMMPIIMAVVTFVSPAALGLYWVVSNLFQLVQQITLDKILSPKDMEVIG
ncbi:MAG: YidC/Oxa1 family membrane protein insertase [Defluviitaleaceae bacterium]|nr:YidC/Oxa1 family membrane protein insertase [Defluviitaleaceae bacterium]